MKNTVCFCSGKLPVPHSEGEWFALPSPFSPGLALPIPPHKWCNMAESPRGTTKETTEYVIKAAMRNSMEAE